MFSWASAVRNALTQLPNPKGYTLHHPTARDSVWVGWGGLGLFEVSLFEHILSAMSCAGPFRNKTHQPSQKPLILLADWKIGLRMELSCNSSVTTCSKPSARASLMWKPERQFGQTWSNNRFRGWTRCLLHAYQLKSEVRTWCLAGRFGLYKKMIGIIARYCALSNILGGSLE